MGSTESDVFHMDRNGSATLVSPPVGSSLSSTTAHGVSMMPKPSARPTCLGFSGLTRRSSSSGNWTTPQVPGPTARGVSTFAKAKAFILSASSQSDAVPATMAESTADASGNCCCFVLANSCGTSASPDAILCQHSCSALWTDCT